MVIVYRSDTGFTKAYAEMLGEGEHLEVFPLPGAVGKVGAGEPVFYMGPLMAGRITGLNQAVRSFNVMGACGVGMSPASPQVLEALSQVNAAPGASLFYLQGGWAPKKVGWLRRRMVAMATKSIREELLAKGGRRTPEEDRYLDFLLHGGSFVARENLERIRQWMAGR